MFNNVAKRLNSKGGTVSALYSSAMRNAITESCSPPRLRPSRFPICSILTYMDLTEAAAKGRFEDERSAAKDFFTSVGTTAHENIQFHLGFSNVLFGDWRCKNKECRKHNLLVANSTNNVCKSCKEPMQYVEKEVSYKGIEGHVDAIIQKSDGTFQIVDFKTTSKAKIEANSLPIGAHKRQIRAYGYLVEKTFPLIDVSGLSILYFGRDNPFNFVEYEEKWTNTLRRDTRSQLIMERKRHLAGIRSFEHQDHSHAVAVKPCQSLAQYKKEVHYYDECPMVSVCFNRKKLEDALDAHSAKHTARKKNRDLILSVIE